MRSSKDYRLSAMPEQNKLAVIYKADSTSVTDITKTVVASFNLGRFERYIRSADSG